MNDNDTPTAPVGVTNRLLAENQALREQRDRLKEAVSQIVEFADRRAGCSVTLNLADLDRLRNAMNAGGEQPDSTLKERNDG